MFKGQEAKNLSISSGSTYVTIDPVLLAWLKLGSRLEKPKRSMIKLVIPIAFGWKLKASKGGFGFCGTHMMWMLQSYNLTNNSSQLRLHRRIEDLGCSPLSMLVLNPKNGRSCGTSFSGVLRNIGNRGFWRVISMKPLV